MRMNLKELNLISFGKFQNQKLPFSSRFNLIFGRNESGKSTLFNAILGIIFGFKNDRNKYRPWKNTSSYTAQLTLETATDTIQIERDFNEDLVSFRQQGRQSPDVTQFKGKASPLGRSSEREAYLRKIHKLFGFSEPDIFRHSLFIGQRSLPELPSVQTTTELKQLISNISEFKYDDIIKRLEAKYFEITKKNPKGIDKRHDRLLENVSDQIRELEERIHRAHLDEKQLCDIGQKVSEIKHKVINKEKLLQKLNKSIDALSERTQVLHLEIGAQKSYAEIKKKKGLVEKVLAEKKQIDDERPKVNRLVLSGMLLGIGLMPVLYFSTNITWIWLFFAFLGLVLGTIKYVHSFKQDSIMYNLKEIRLKSQLEVLPKLQQIDEQFIQAQNHLADIQTQKANLEKHISNTHLQGPTKDIDTLVNDQQDQIHHLERDIQQLQSKYHMERQNYLMLSKGLESPFTLEEDLFDLKEKEKNLRVKAQALLTAKDMLRDIVVAFRKEHLNVFAAQTKEIFQKIASPDYHQLDIHDSNLSPSLKSVHSEGEAISLGSLSCGTQDQLFFSMKLSLLDLLSSSQKLPLFLDDPFVNFDHERRKRTVGLLKDISNERQIFLFTYDPWFLQQLSGVATIIQLERPHEAHA